MSAVVATVQALLADPSVTGIVARRIWPVVAPQDSKRPSIVVHRISEDDEMLLKGHSGILTARVSIEARADSFTEADALGTAIADALKPLHRADYEGKKVSFSKAASDVSDHTDQTGVHRRILDFYIRLQ